MKMQLQRRERYGGGDERTEPLTVDPNQCSGRPCVHGLRIRVKDVPDLLAAGADLEEILGDYPLLEAGDIAAALSLPKAPSRRYSVSTFSFGSPA